MGMLDVNFPEAMGTTKDDDQEPDVVEEKLRHPLFIRVIEMVLWLLVAALSALLLLFLLYQINALYGPYVVAKLMGDRKHRFPDYVYEVWGKDITDLGSEQWGLLCLSLGCLYVSANFALRDPPFQRGGQKPKRS